MRHRFLLYCALNVGFLLLLGIGCAVGAPANPRLLYVAVLFALCSSAVIDLDGLNGRYSLLALFSLAYFVFFGVGDSTNLVFGEPSNVIKSQAALTATEAVILVGGGMFVLSYRLATIAIGSIQRRSPPKDWAMPMVTLIGLLFWAIGTFATFRWYVYIVTDSTNEAIRKGLNSLSTLSATIYVLAQMMQPLGILLLIYAFRVSRRPYALPLIVGIVAFQVALGFVVDIKGLAMLGGILVIVCSILLDGRLPKTWLAGAIVFIVFAFPVFQAYRAEVRGERGIARTTVIENFGKTLNIALSAEHRVNTGHDRALTFFERASLKGVVQVIVEKTGNGVDFQNGYTLTPILAAFVPKLLWPDKPNVPTGQLVDRAFHFDDSDATYISPSHLGELYWNFGWGGVVIGMAIIGLICGYIGSRFNLTEFRTVSRLLVMVITIKQLIWGFESSIADIYVVWLRSLAGIGLLHLIFARAPVAARLFQPANAGSTRTAADPSRSERLFPNLLT
jgi:O-antigen polysaccharide polymerase Wzy